MTTEIILSPQNVLRTDPAKSQHLPPLYGQQYPEPIAIVIPVENNSAKSQLNTN
jgi:hypothetical protein